MRPEGSLNKIKLAVGNEPEIMAPDRRCRRFRPVTINGRLTRNIATSAFTPTKGQNLIVEVNAARFGSPLDSVLEILDADGKPIERATIRAIARELHSPSTIAIRCKPGLRLLTITGFTVGDYMMVGSEIVRVAVTPHGPDEDTFFESFGGQRIAYFDTSGEGHAMDSPDLQGADPAAGRTPACQRTSAGASDCIATTTADPATARIHCSISRRPRMAIMWSA